MSAPRYIIPKQTYLITRRCSERRFFLRPDEVTTQLFLYALAEAAQRFGIRVLAWVAMSNHYHAIVEDPYGQLPAFLCHFHKMSARSLNRRWKRAENFWAAEPASVVRLVQCADVLDKTVYALVNPVVANLVERMGDWPGATSFHILEGEVLRIERPRIFYRDDGSMPAVVELRAEAPTDWPGGAASWTAAVLAAAERRVAQANEQRRAAGARVIGRRALLELDPESKPATAAPRGGLRPELACLDPERRRAELGVLERFRAAYVEARAGFIARAQVVFPWGTYKLVRELGAMCAPAPA